MASSVALHERKHAVYTAYIEWRFNYRVHGEKIFLQAYYLKFIESRPKPLDPDQSLFIYTTLLELENSQIATSNGGRM